MAKLEALRQQSAIEHSFSPISSSNIEGGGVPKMHPLKSSGPIFKAANLIHIAKFGRTGGVAKVRMPKMPRMKGLLKP